MKTFAEPLLTVADLEGMPEDGNRYELIEGELFVSTAPSYFHQFVLVQLILAFGSYLKEQPIGEISPGIGMVFDDLTGVVPDLVYTSNERLARILEGGRLTEAPEIAIEIISPGRENERRDKVVKRRLYSFRGVHEYWLIDPQSRSVEILRKRKTGGLHRLAVLQDGDELTSVEPPGFRVAVSTLFK